MVKLEVCVVSVHLTKHAGKCCASDVHSDHWIFCTFHSFSDSVQ